jgi:glycogen debranching enzyme
MLPKAAPGRLARGPSTDRLKALSVVDDDEWCKGVSFADWHDLVQRSFERHFWIPEDAAEDCSYAMGGTTPWVRGMYKDCLGCHDEWCMLQLRPNQAVAPSLFDPDHARVRPTSSRTLPATSVSFTSLNLGDHEMRCDMMREMAALS